MIIKLNNSVLDEIDTSEYRKYTDTNMLFGSCFHHPSGTEHYRLLMYISSQFTNHDIFEVGTCGGASSLALSSNKTNTIHTFDVENMRAPNLSDVENIIFYVDNILDNIEKYKEKLLNSAFIFLDVYHMGVFEKEFYTFLLNNNYKGFLIMDDISHTGYPKLIEVWDEIKSDKIILTKYGHNTGTGVITFNNEIQFALE